MMHYEFDPSAGTNGNLILRDLNRGSTTTKQNHSEYQKWKKANDRLKALLTPEQMTATEATVLSGSTAWWIGIHRDSHPQFGFKAPKHRYALVFVVDSRESRHKEVNVSARCLGSLGIFQESPIPVIIPHDRNLGTLGRSTAYARPDPYMCAASFLSAEVSPDEYER